MTTAKARIIGIFYTFIFATAQSVAVAFFLFWLGDLQYSKMYDSKVLYFFLDRGIPIVFLTTLYFARNLGSHLILSQGNTKKTSVILLNIGIVGTAITFLWFLLYKVDFSSYDVDDGLIMAGLVALNILFLYLAHILPSLYLADKLEWLIKRYRSKQP